MNISDEVNYKSILERKCRETNKRMPEFEPNEYLDGYICKGKFENDFYYTGLFNKEEHTIQDICRQVLNEQFGYNFELVFDKSEDERGEGEESEHEGEESDNDF